LASDADDKLRQRVKQIAETVRATGRPVKLEPMNSYDRRIVHNALTVIRGHEL